MSVKYISQICNAKQFKHFNFCFPFGVLKPQIKWYESMQMIRPSNIWGTMSQTGPRLTCNLLQLIHFNNTNKYHKKPNAKSYSVADLCDFSLPKFVQTLFYDLILVYYCYTIMDLCSINRFPKYHKISQNVTSIRNIDCLNLFRWNTLKDILSSSFTALTCSLLVSSWDSLSCWSSCRVAWWDSSSFSNCCLACASWSVTSSSFSLCTVERCRVYTRLKIAMFVLRISLKQTDHRLFFWFI